MFSLKSWSTAVGTALVALGAVGCGAYEPEPEVPQYEYAAPPRPLTAEELAQQQAAQQQQQGGEEIAIGEDDANADEYSDTDPSALTEFKPALDGHGAWVEDASYGTVWVPASSEVGTDFQPYVTAGHWTYADDTDYVWVSDYSWGWAPFHYGRWVYLPGHGWSWIPGRRYSGAWVTWRTGPVGYGYIGWAPMGPSYYWSNGYAVGWSYGFYRPHDHYVYCAHDRFYGGGYNSYVVRGPAMRTHYERTVEYTPQPRVAASPTVNGGGGRVIANPSVGGGQRIAASPTVRRGPRPEEIGMGKDTIVAPPSQGQSPGMDRARTLASPSSAVAAGARAPALRTASLNPNRGPASGASVPGGSPAFRSAQPSVGGSPSFAGSAPSQPRVAMPSSRPSASAPSAPTFRSSPSFSPSSPAFRPSQPSVSSSPAFRPSQPSVSSSPSFRSQPSVTARPSISSSAPARSAPSPSFRSSAPTVTSRPSVSSAPRSSGSIVRSSPSVSAPRPSSGGSSPRGSVRRR